MALLDTYLYVCQAPRLHTASTGCILKHLYVLGLKTGRLLTSMWHMTKCASVQAGVLIFAVWALRVTSYLYAQAERYFWWWQISKP
jgi:hypothetical protein